jgi:hypothetical protein
MSSELTSALLPTFYIVAPETLSLKRATYTRGGSKGSSVSARTLTLGTKCDGCLRFYFGCPGHRLSGDGTGSGRQTSLATSLGRRRQPAHHSPTPAVSSAEEHSPPSPPALLPLGRRLADGLSITRWSHHLQAFNKAADTATNVATDTRRSIQNLHPTARPEWAGLDQLSAGDFLHWQASNNGSL